MHYYLTNILAYPLGTNRMHSTRQSLEVIKKLQSLNHSCLVDVRDKEKHSNSVNVLIVFFSPTMTVTNMHLVFL